MLPPTVPKRQIFGWDAPPRRDDPKSLRRAFAQNAVPDDEREAFALPRTRPAQWTASGKVKKPGSRAGSSRASTASGSVRDASLFSQTTAPSWKDAAPPLRPPVDLVDSSLRAEVSLATASAMRAKALLEYREARCRGAAWLWARATNRAGGSRTICLMIFHLWNNFVKATKDREAQVDEIIFRYARRRRRFVVREWRRAAKAQRADRKHELVVATAERELWEAREDGRIAKGRADELETRVEDLEKKLKAAKARELSDEARARIDVERAEDRARADRAEAALLVMVGAAAVIVPASLDAAQRGLFRARTTNEVSSKSGGVRATDEEPDANGFDVRSEKGAARWGGAPRYPDLRGILDADIVKELAKPRAPEPGPKGEAPDAPDAAAREDVPETIVLAWANAASRDAGRGGAPDAAVLSMPAYQAVDDWRTAFTDGRQLARILFGELEALLPGRLVKGVEVEADDDAGLELLLGEKRAGPALWRRRVEPGTLLTFASDVRSRLARPQDLATYLEGVATDLLGLPPGLLKADDLRRRDVDWHFPFLSYLMCKGCARVVDFDQEPAPDGEPGKYRHAALEMGRIRRKWARLRTEFLVPPRSDEDDVVEVPVPPRDAIDRLLPPQAALQGVVDDVDLDAGVGDLVQLAVDAAKLVGAVGAVEADEWRNAVLWDSARNAVEAKCFAELSRRGRIVPGPGFNGRVAKEPA